MMDSLNTSRRSYWGEIEAKERTDRLRKEVKALQVENRALIDIIEQLLKHTHGVNGELKVPIPTGIEAIIERMELHRIGFNDEVYF